MTETWTTNDAAGADPDHAVSDAHGARIAVRADGSDEPLAALLWTFQKRGSTALRSLSADQEETE